MKLYFLTLLENSSQFFLFSDFCELIEEPIVEIEDPGKTLKNAENESAQLKVFLLSGEKESETHLQEMLVLEKPAVLSQNIKSEDGGLNGITSQGADIFCLKLFFL